MEHIHSTHNNIYKISLAFIWDEVGEIFFIVHEELFYQDCRSMEFEYFPFESDEYELILVDSRVKQDLASLLSQLE